MKEECFQSVSRLREMFSKTIVNSDVLSNDIHMVQPFEIRLAYNGHVEKKTMRFLVERPAIQQGFGRGLVLEFCKFFHGGVMSEFLQTKNNLEHLV